VTGERILVVEDELIVAMNIESKLQELGYEVIDVVDNGKDAIDRALETKPDLILMDIVLKGEMDGIEVVRRINSTMDVPVIYLTAYSDDEVIQRAKRTEPYGYILKPFKKGEIKATIEIALQRHKSEMDMRDILKQKIFSDFYEFLLGAMPSSADESSHEAKKMLLNVFAERIDEDLKPFFKDRIENLSPEEKNDPVTLFEYYTSWLVDMFSRFGVQSKIVLFEGKNYIEFLNCPWIEEAVNKPFFCLNCHSMIKRSLKWTKLDIDAHKMTTIAEGGHSCVFEFE